MCARVCVSVQLNSALASEESCKQGQHPALCRQRCSLVLRLAAGSPTSSGSCLWFHSSAILT